MDSLNQQLFLLINAAHQPGSFLMSITKGIAEMPLVIVPVCLLTLWFTSSRGKAVAFHAALATVLALTTNLLISLLWYHNRPFADHLGLQLIAHVTDSSFPSDHVTLMAGIGFAIGRDKTYRLLAGVILALSALTGWARVYVGVHYPFDILGAYLVSGAVVWGYFQWLSARFTPLLNGLINIERAVLHRGR